MISIVSREYIRSLGRAAFEAGESRDSHYMNWHAPALVDWHAGFDEAAAEVKKVPPSHGAADGSTRIEIAQVRV